VSLKKVEQIHLMLEVEEYEEEEQQQQIDKTQQIIRITRTHTS